MRSDTTGCQAIASQGGGMTNAAKRLFLEAEGLEFREWHFPDDPHIMRSWFAGPGIKNPMSTDFAYTKYMKTKKEKEKREFLEREGWDFLPEESDIWRSPEDRLMAWRLGETLENAFRIASRRKQARELARLRKAGAEYCVWVISDGGDHIKCWCINSRFVGHTRQEAIAYLDKLEANK